MKLPLNSPPIDRMTGCPDSCEGANIPALNALADLLRRQSTDGRITSVAHCMPNLSGLAFVSETGRLRLTNHSHDTTFHRTLNRIDLEKLRPIIAKYFTADGPGFTECRVQAIAEIVQSIC